MRWIGLALPVALALAALVHATPASGDPEPRFVALDLRIDAGEAPLAAWQVEVTYDPATTKVLSLEGGETEGFREAPHHDRRGLEGGRIVIASYVPADTAAPAGETRVARLHLQTTGEVGAPRVRLVTAARPGGAKIEARATLASSTDDEGRKQE
ncbi:MAG: hypothetical protein ABFS86_09195 [Planctomycetota bacterium]